MTSYTNPLGPYLTCNHNCHRPTNRAKVLTGLHVYNSEADGIVRHRSQHRCTADCPSAESDRPEHWPTTDAEYIRFGHRLYHSLRGSPKERMTILYREAWERFHETSSGPIPPVPMHPDGTPMDFAKDERYPTAAIWAPSLPEDPNRPVFQFPALQVPSFQATLDSIQARYAIPGEASGSTLARRNTRLLNPPPSSESSSTSHSPRPAPPPSPASSTTSVIADAHPTQARYTIPGEASGFVLTPRNNRLLNPPPSLESSSTPHSPQLVSPPSPASSTTSVIAGALRSGPDSLLSSRAASPARSHQVCVDPTAEDESGHGSSLKDNEEDCNREARELLTYLRRHDFGVEISVPYARIPGGLLPGLSSSFHIETSAEIRVLFVDNPEYNHAMTEPDDVATSSQELPEGDFYAIQAAMPKSIKRIRKCRKHKGCIIAQYNSWLNLPLMMRRTGRWKVTFMDFETLIHALVDPQTDEHKAALSRILNETDVILGGIDFSSAFLEFVPFSPAQMDEFYRRMVKISKTKTVWPSPQDQLNCGAKCHLYHQLELCALSMDQPYPIRCSVREAPAVVAERIMKGDLNAVLKREYSACSLHVVTPHSTHAIKDLDAQLEIEEHTWGAPGHNFARPQWFLQPYIPELISMGELRAFVVNGHLLYIVYTKPTGSGNAHELQLQCVQHIVRLSKISHPRQENDFLAHFEDRNLILSVECSTDFHKYVLETVGKLVILTERQTGRFSDLRIMCRVDVSVFWDGRRGRYRYFTNEITQGLNTTAFVNETPADTIYVLYRELEASLYHSVRSRLLLQVPPPCPVIDTCI